MPSEVDLFGEPIANGHKSVLARTFDYPPFSVLNAREGWWQDRKRQWLALGIKSELGRGGGDASTGKGAGSIRHTWWPCNLAAGPQRMTNYARTFGQDLMRGEHRVGGGQVSAAGPRTGDFAGLRAPGVGPGGNVATGCYAIGGAKNDEGEQTGTSIFDPVLTELCYRWFCPPGGVIADPFAGGSVRGIVASVLGYDYQGFELRGEQVAANRAQAAAICPERPPVWIEGDSSLTMPAWGGAADFVFSCPPYGDLEVYSDRYDDLSAMPHDAFIEAYRAIIAAAVAVLKPDRFAAFVVGDFRCKKGFYRNFTGTTVDAFEAAGARLYNEAILVTAVGSLPVRVGRQFKAGRKLGKTHQNILVFCKGDPKRAAQACEGVAV